MASEGAVHTTHVRPFRLPHYEDYPVQVALFKNVSNAAFLRSQLLDANADFDYAFLDAAMILSPQHLLSASFLALHHTLTNTLKARTPHSELVFRLHPNNNIGESYRKFGISDTTTNLIAVKLTMSRETSSESVARHLGESVQGESVEIGEDGEELGMFTDLDMVSKVYKLDGLGSAGAGAKEGAVNSASKQVDKRREMEGVVLGIMTIKGS